MTNDNTRIHANVVWCGVCVCVSSGVRGEHYSQRASLEAISEIAEGEVGEVRSVCVKEM